MNNEPFTLMYSVHPGGVSCHRTNTRQGASTLSPFSKVSDHVIYCRYLSFLFFQFRFFQLRSDIEELSIHPSTYGASQSTSVTDRHSGEASLLHMSYGG